MAKIKNLKNKFAYKTIHWILEEKATKYTVVSSIRLTWETISKRVGTGAEMVQRCHLCTWSLHAGSIPAKSHMWVDFVIVEVILSIGLEQNNINHSHIHSTVNFWSPAWSWQKWLNLNFQNLYLIWHLLTDTVEQFLIECCKTKSIAIHGQSQQA